MTGQDSPRLVTRRVDRVPARRIPKGMTSPAEATAGTRPAWAAASGTAGTAATPVPVTRASSSSWSGLLGQRGDDGRACLLERRALSLAEPVEDQPPHRR